MFAGSARPPREIGTAMLVRDGGQQGSIGGRLKHDATPRTREMRAYGEARAFVRAALGPDFGQCNGGRVALLFACFGTLPETLPDMGTAFARRVGDPTEAGAAPPDTPPLPALRNHWVIEPVAPHHRGPDLARAGHVGREPVHVLAPLPGFAITLVDTTPARFPRPRSRPMSSPVPPSRSPASCERRRRRCITSS